MQNLNQTLTEILSDTNEVSDEIQAKIEILKNITGSKDFKAVIFEYLKDLEKLLNNIEYDSVLDKKVLANDIKKYLTNGIIIADRALTAAKFGKFSNELDDLVNCSVIPLEKVGVLNEIMEQYLFAQRSLSIYHNARVYQYLRRDSRQTYKNIRTKETDVLMNKYIAKEFLR